MKRRLTLVLPLSAAFAVLLFAAGLMIDSAFSRPAVVPFYDGPHRVWAHRGAWKGGGGEENSLSAIRRAFDLGAAGVELDVRYDAAMGDFVVSHEYPYEVKEGRLLLLGRVFGESGGRGRFWLDFKDLRDMDGGQARAALARLLELLDLHGLRGLVIVESRSASNLALFARAGLFTSYCVANDRRRGALERWWTMLSARFHLLRGRFSAVSMKAEDYTPEVERALGPAPVPVHLFTVNDRARLLELAGKPRVRIILTDEESFLPGAPPRPAGGTGGGTGP